MSAKFEIASSRACNCAESALVRRQAPLQVLAAALLQTVIGVLEARQHHREEMQGVAHPLAPARDVFPQQPRRRHHTHLMDLIAALPMLLAVLRRHVGLTSMVMGQMQQNLLLSHPPLPQRLGLDMVVMPDAILPASL